MNEAGITKDSFIVRRELFEFIDGYNQQYGDIPSKAIVENNFEDFKQADDVKVEERKYLVGEVVKNDIRAKAIKIINKGSDLIADDPRGAVDFLISKLSGIKSGQSFSKSFTDRDAMNRLKEFEGKKEKIGKGILSGIKTGLSIFDDKMIGWQPGNLVGIVGRLGVGKSWIAEWIGCSAYSDGNRVVYVSPEMTIPEVEARWDTIMSAINGNVFPNDDLLLGKVDVDKYKEFLERVSTRKDWQTLDSNNGRPFTVSALQAIVDDFKPNVMVIDGFLLLKSETPSESSWQSLMDIAYGLKAIAQNNKIVVIVTAQANRQAAFDMPDVSQVFGGDSLMMAVDVGIMVAKLDEDQPMQRCITIPKVRGRKNFTKKININFDVNLGIVGV